MELAAIILIGADGFIDIHQIVIHRDAGPDRAFIRVVVRAGQVADLSVHELHHAGQAGLRQLVFGDGIALHILHSAFAVIVTGQRVHIAHVLVESFHVLHDTQSALQLMILEVISIRILERSSFFILQDFSGIEVAHLVIHRLHGTGEIGAILAAFPADDLAIDAFHAVCCISQSRDFAHGLIQLAQVGFDGSICAIVVRFGNDIEIISISTIVIIPADGSVQGFQVRCGSITFLYIAAIRRAKFTVHGSAGNEVCIIGLYLTTTDATLTFDGVIVERDVVGNVAIGVRGVTTGHCNAGTARNLHSLLRQRLHFALAGRREIGKVCIRFAGVQCDEILVHIVSRRNLIVAFFAFGWLLQFPQCLIHRIPGDGISIALCNLAAAGHRSAGGGDFVSYISITIRGRLDVNTSIPSFHFDSACNLRNAFRVNVVKADACRIGIGCGSAGVGF